MSRLHLDPDTTLTFELDDREDLEPVVEAGQLREVGYDYDLLYCQTPLGRFRYIHNIDKAPYLARPPKDDEPLHMIRLDVSQSSYRFDAEASLLNFSGPPEPPEFIVQDLLPVAAGGVVGTGGAMKSSFMLWLAHHITGEIPVYGREILRPGPCLILTAEDERKLLEFRAYHMQQELLKDYAKNERLTLLTRWSQRVHVEDVSGELQARLVRAVNGEMLEAPDVEALIDAYRGRDLSLLVIDPTVYFGPGENSLNDGMAALMAVGKKFSKALNCAVVFVHHVSQDVSRNEIIDAHSGRSGTAFGDNGRFMYVMVVDKGPGNGKKRTYIVPQALQEAGVTEPVRLHHVKNSFGVRLQEPLWFARDPTNAWAMLAAESDVRTEEDVQAEKEAKDTDDAQAFIEWFAGMFPEGASLADIEKSHEFLKLRGKEASRNRARGLANLSVSKGWIERDKTQRYEPLVLTKAGREAAGSEDASGGEMVARCPEKTASEASEAAA